MSIPPTPALPATPAARRAGRAQAGAPDADVFAGLVERHLAGKQHDAAERDEAPARPGAADRVREHAPVPGRTRSPRRGPSHSTAQARTDAATGSPASAAEHAHPEPAPATAPEPVAAATGHGGDATGQDAGAPATPVAATNIPLDQTATVAVTAGPVQAAPPVPTATADVGGGLAAAGAAGATAAAATPSMPRAGLPGGQPEASATAATDSTSVAAGTPAATTPAPSAAVRPGPPVPGGSHARAAEAIARPATGTTDTVANPAAVARPTDGPGARPGHPADQAAPSAPSTSITPTATASPNTPSPAVAAAGPTGPTAGTAPATGSAVLHQVLPVVPRLVSRGDGTHRMTLTLHPADLGEVQLTVTVRAGTVDVTLAAGAHARDALRDGFPELRSLLGHAAGTVTVRDLPAGTTAGVPLHDGGAGTPFAAGGDAHGGRHQPGGRADGHGPPLPDTGDQHPLRDPGPVHPHGRTALDVRI